MSVEEVIAEALRGCGIEEPEKVEVPDILDALNAAGYAVVPKSVLIDAIQWRDRDALRALPDTARGCGDTWCVCSNPASEANITYRRGYAFPYIADGATEAGA